VAHRIEGSIIVGTFPLVSPLPLTLLLVAAGLAAWANGMYFLGIGATPAEGSANPAKTVGAISLVAGIVMFVNVGYMIFIVGGNGVAVAALATLYAAFFTTLGISLVWGLDLRPIANICLPIAVGSLPFITKFFDKDLLFQSIMVVWTVAFLAIFATVYGKFQAKWLGWILLVTAVWTFFLPALRIAMGADWLIQK
jgi:hypothetical protein